MANLNKELADLTPEQRQLIELMLRKSDAPALDSQQTSAPIQHWMTGLVPLTGSQQWFLENVDDYCGGLWNMSLLYDVPSFLGRSPELIAKVFEHLMAYHDGLRAYFVRQQAGWQQLIAEPGGPVPFTYFDLAALEISAQNQAIQAASDALQLDMALSTPLLRVSLFYLGDNRPARLLIRVHHLVRDGLSLSILTDDLQTAYQQLACGEPIQFLPKTASVHEYVERLQAYARSDEMRRELDGYWLTLPWNQVAPLPVDDPTGETRRTLGSMANLDVSLDADETRILQTIIPRVYKAQVSDVLLMALMQAVTRWTGRSHQLIGWIYDGRGSAVPGVAGLDLSRTVGWLGHNSYLLLERVAAHSPAESLQAIQEQVRRIPNKGMGWYLLRYYGDAEMVERVQPLIRDEMIVEVNYLGAMGDPSASQFEIMRPVNVPLTIPVNPQSRDFQPRLNITIRILGGRFTADWEYNSSEYHRATIERIASDFREALRDLVLTSPS